MNSCQLCLSDSVVEMIDFGLQPISNRFLKNKGDPDLLYPIAIGQCQTCGLIQLLQAAPPEELRPKVDWITYNEPEGHLDELAEVIAKLPGLTSDSIIWGVSFKDDTLLKRLERLGYPKIYRLNPNQDLGIPGTGAGVETIQDKMTVEVMKEAVIQHGQPQMIIARHIVEHAHQLQDFILAMLTILPEDGYLILEAPDCQGALERLDYTTIWEEHTFYFTPATYSLILPAFNLQTIYQKTFVYGFENSMVSIGKITPKGQSISMQSPTLFEEITRMKRFGDQFLPRRAKIQQYLQRYKAEHGKIAMLGAGHLACAFINFLGIEGSVEFIADDNPHKQNLFMPLSGLPILPSTALHEQKIKLCLLSLSPEVEDKVIAKNQVFLEAGGQFASIFPASKRAITYEGI